MDFHFPNAIKNGVTAEELVEMITHLAFYVGWPSAISAITRAKALLAPKDIKIRGVVTNQDNARSCAEYGESKGIR